MRKTIIFLTIVLLTGCATVRLPAHPSIRDYWVPDIEPVSERFVPDDPDLIGGPGTQVFRFSGPIAKRVRFVSTNGETRERVVAALVPDGPVTREVETQQYWPFPAEYNTCDHHWCPPVRNQGQCGSCWAFATNAVTEYVIYNAIRDQDPTITALASADSSEQFLVSCNTRGWGCHGGHWAYMFWHDEPVAADQPIGLVPEWSCPYRALDLECNTPYRHAQKLTDWHYVLGCGVNLIPTVSQVKQAIIEDGIVGTGICVNSAFADHPTHYDERDVFQGPYCYGINHVVTIIGWDDDRGAWLIQNSWGEGWGNRGRVWVPYGKADIQNCAVVAQFDNEYETVGWYPIVLKGWRRD